MSRLKRNSSKHDSIEEWRKKKYSKQYKNLASPQHDPITGNLIYKEDVMYDGSIAKYWWEYDKLGRLIKYYNSFGYSETYTYLGMTNIISSKYESSKYQGQKCMKYTSFDRSGCIINVEYYMEDGTIKYTRYNIEHRDAMPIHPIFIIHKIY